VKGFTLKFIHKLELVNLFLHLFRGHYLINVYVFLSGVTYYFVGN
jgi:hypothetical protein